MEIGYCRVSTEDQNLDRQQDAIKRYGVDKLYSEKMTGTKSNRPELNRLQENLRDGDTVVVESLSRLSRSSKDLLEILGEFKAKGVKLVSLKENVDTSTPTGMLLLTVLGAISQFEREVIVQRTCEGLAAARARGRVGGRPPLDQKKVQSAVLMYQTQSHTVNEIKELTGVSSSTLYRYLRNVTKIKEA